MSKARLKRAFVMPLFTFLGLELIHSLWRVLTTGFAPVWIGSLAVAGAFFAGSSGFRVGLRRSGDRRISRMSGPSHVR
jgi:hypothetical protein